MYSSIMLNSTSENADYQFAIDIAKDCEKIIIASYFYIRSDVNGNALSGIQLNFLKKLLAMKKQVIFISFENPYILSNFPQIENYICTFSSSKSSQRAVVNLLKGLIEPEGSLPVSIPLTEYKIGYSWKPNN
jgi:beta-N-acetylhexosaminidase